MDIPISQFLYGFHNRTCLRRIPYQPMKRFCDQEGNEIPDLVFCYPVVSFSGNENPADLETRGVSTSALLTSLLLCPKFLNTFYFQPEYSVPTLNDPVSAERCCI
ncbi:hypothetical protein CDAR_224421 [Caerostris darwini]|uniref:Uncharacterized protein n=1 Tax=Caerostris darwini TaxID=1538125 RepID=A0AAV4X141_9ARAC|nr:hypothetical protein CDAR_224421 [Caerostris darwini]